MNRSERLERFRTELAEICEFYAIEINTECGCRIGASPSECATDCVLDFAPNSTPDEIRNTPIQ